MGTPRGRPEQERESLSLNVVKVGKLNQDDRPPVIARCKPLVPIPPDREMRDQPSRYPGTRLYLLSDLRARVLGYRSLRLTLKTARFEMHFFPFFYHPWDEHPMTVAVSKVGCQAGQESFTSQPEQVAAFKRPWDLRSRLRGIWLPQTLRAASRPAGSPVSQPVQVCHISHTGRHRSFRTQMVTPAVIFDAFLRFLLFCPSTTPPPPLPLTHSAPLPLHVPTSRLFPSRTAASMK